MSETPPLNHFGEEAPLVDLAEFASWIIYDDENLMAVNKPGWLVCHPSKNGPLSSLVGAAREYTRLDTIHLVSRLDRETSGVVILAKNKQTASILQKAVEDRLVDKTYLAILDGEFFGTAIIAQPLIADDKSAVVIKQQCCMRKTSAKDAVTIFTSLRRPQSLSKYTLAQIKIPTGRKHQIRAHAQWMGHAVAGDKIYGADETLYLDFVEKGFTPQMAKVLPIARQALHAWKLDFSKLLEGMVFTAPHQPDFAEFAAKNDIILPS